MAITPVQPILGNSNNFHQHSNNETNSKNKSTKQYGRKPRRIHRSLVWKELPTYNQGLDVYA